jgi:hypothetical protein
VVGSRTVLLAFGDRGVTSVDVDWYYRRAGGWVVEMDGASVGDGALVDCELVDLRSRLIWHENNTNSQRTTVGSVTYIFNTYTNFRSLVKCVSGLVRLVAILVGYVLRGCRYRRGSLRRRDPFQFHNTYSYQTNVELFYTSSFRSGCYRAIPI